MTSHSPVALQTPHKAMTVLYDGATALQVRDHWKDAEVLLFGDGLEIFYEIIK